MAYRLVIEFSCVERWEHSDVYQEESSLFVGKCNVARYVGVWIDFNDDGLFDESGELVHATHGHVQNQIDVSINIPEIDGRQYLPGEHRMRLVVTEDETNRRPCNNFAYGEARDYTVRIRRKFNNRQQL